jgi:hypothetical protein
MIDGYSLLFEALWILGLSLVAAGLSLANYLAKRENWTFRQAFKSPGRRAMIDLGLLFFCIGLAGTTGWIWGRIVWAALALFYALRVWRDKMPIVG